MPVHLRRTPRAPAPTSSPRSSRAAGASSSPPRRRLPRRLRVLLATRPLAYWSLTAVIALALGATVYGVAASAEETRARLGVSKEAIVATRAIAAGEALDGTDTEVRVLPAGVVAAGTLASLPPGAVAAAAIAAGEPVNRLRVGRGGDGPVAALLPDGTRGIAVPVGPDGLPLRPGDLVDVVAAVAAGNGGAARTVAAGALVVHVDDKAVVVAVGAAETTAVAQALADGAVVLALSAGPSRTP